VHILKQLSSLVVSLSVEKALALFEQYKAIVLFKCIYYSRKGKGIASVVHKGFSRAAQYTKWHMVLKRDVLFSSLAN